jgi:hypothetical protein
MEMFSADNDEQWDTIKATIDFSDYYLLIIGHRYGSETKEGISFTEKEFNYAKEKGVPILAFIRHRDTASTPGQRDKEVYKQEKLEVFITKASTNGMVDFWTDEKDLATKVIIALTKTFNKTPRVGWIRADKAMSPKVAEELALLSQENRLLKDALENIKNKTASRQPVFQVIINGKEQVVEKFISDSILISKSEYYLKHISEDDIDSGLQRYVNKNDLKIFNTTIDSNHLDVTDYNEDTLNYERLSKTYKLYDISVKNIGTIKATNVVVDIDVPAELLFFKESDISKFFMPEIPTIIHSNPIENAQKEKARAERNKMEFKKLSDSRTENFEVLENPNYSIDDGSLKITFSHILHTQLESISRKIAMVSFSKGEFELTINIICEEFDAPQICSFSITFS